MWGDEDTWRGLICYGYTSDTVRQKHCSPQVCYLSLPADYLTVPNKQVYRPKPQPAPQQAPKSRAPSQAPQRAASKAPTSAAVGGQVAAQIQARSRGRSRTPRQPRAQSQPPRAQAQSRDAFKLTRCGFDYFRALYNPFSLTGLPCIPSTTPTPSQKIKVVTRGTFTVGTLGSGGACFWPFRMVSSSNLYGSTYTAYAPALITTTSAYPNADYTFTNGVGGVPGVGETYWPGTTSVFDAPSLGGYTAAGVRVNSNRSAKLVAAGLQVQYADKVLDMSGSYITWRNPNATSNLAANRDTVNDLLRVNAADLRRVNGEWVGVSYIPLQESDLAPVPEPGNPDTPAVGSVYNRLACGVFITNAQPGQRFEFEAVAYFEVSGDGVSVTPSHSDPAALGAILSINTPVVIPNLREAERSAFSNLVETVKQMGYSGLRVLGGAAGTAVVRGLGLG